jgi:hypothetical protein
MKQPTTWITQSGLDLANAANAGFSLLLETGSRLLSETSSKVLLEDAVVITRELTSWVPSTKLSTAWEARDGFSTQTTGIGDTRTTLAADTRTTQQGDTRITELSTFIKKQSTSWVEL